MPDYIASVDAGNGGTNAVLVKAGTTSYRSVYLPSVRAAATGDSLGLGSGLELQYETYDWRGNRYVVGDDVVNVTRRHLERHMGVDRYGNEFHKFLVAIALAQLGVKKGKVDLTLFAPPGLYRNLKTEIQEAFVVNEGKVSLKLGSEKDARHWQYDNVTLWPEGIGAAACFVLNEKGEAVPSTIFEGQVIIFDLGAYTLDSLKLMNGNFNPETLEHATHEDAGLHTHLRQPLLRQLHSTNEDFTTLTMDDVDVLIRRGLQTGDFTVRAAGKEADLKPAFDKLRTRYAEWIANNIIDSLFDGLRGVRAVVLVGGGSLLVQDYMREWYGDKILNPAEHPTTKKIHPVDFNAVGGLRFALMRLKKAQN